MTRQRTTLLRVVVGALAAGSLLAQLVVVPRVASDLADRYPEVANLERPYVIAVVAAIGAFQVALLAAWQLPAAAAGGAGATRRSTRRVDVLAFSLCAMALVLAGICVHAGFVAHVGGPATGFGLLASLALAAGAVAARKQVLVVLVDGDADRLGR